MTTHCTEFHHTALLGSNQTVTGPILPLMFMEPLFEVAVAQVAEDLPVEVLVEVHLAGVLRLLPAVH